MVIVFSVPTMERRATEKRRDPMLENAEVTYAQMCSMHQKRGEDLRINQLRDHWDNLQAITEDNQSETTAGYTKMSFPTMCAMLQYRGQRFSEDQLKEQWRYLRQVEETTRPTRSPCSAPRDADDR